jgi:hypothetical protein
MEDLESVQAELESREKTLIQQEDLFIASKEALALERSEVESLYKALAKEQGDHAITKKENIALKKKYCDLNKKHKELGLQYNNLWDSNSHPSKAEDTSTPSTSQGCGKYYNLDLNAYSTCGGIDPYTLMAAHGPCRRRWPNSLEQVTWITQLIGVPRGIYED